MAEKRGIEVIKVGIGVNVEKEIRDVAQRSVRISAEGRQLLKDEKERQKARIQSETISNERDRQCEVAASALTEKGTLSVDELTEVAGVERKQLRGFIMSLRRYVRAKTPDTDLEKVTKSGKSFYRLAKTED